MTRQDFFAQNASLSETDEYDERANINEERAKK